jgi:hypothetical protein
MASRRGFLMCYPAWLSPLEFFNTYDGWQDYVNCLYEIYLIDFIQNPIVINGKRIQQRRLPQIQGKDKAFWHICGHDNEQNLPKDFSRFERIRWPKAIILNRDDTTIKIWQDNHYAKAGEKLQISIWFNEEYLVVLEPRNDYILFITAYCTDRNHKIRALQKRFNEKCQEGYVL